jgi:hypothetical protein
MTILAEERTTLPDGATLSVVRGQHSALSATVGTYLIAMRERERLQMRVDDVSPHNLRQYLDLLVREIRREQARFNKKPWLAVASPHTIHDFVANMATKAMFIEDVLQ